MVLQYSWRKKQKLTLIQKHREVKSKKEKIKNICHRNTNCKEAKIAIIRQRRPEQGILSDKEGHFIMMENNKKKK